MPARPVLAGLAVVVLLLTACGTATEQPGATPGPDETAGGAVEPSAGAAPSTGAEEAAEPQAQGIQVQSDPGAGIFFDDVPDLTGDEAAVYDAIAEYEKAVWQTWTTNEVSPAFTGTVAPHVIDFYAQMAAREAGAGWRAGGEYHVRISEIAVTGDTATGLACEDHTWTVYETPDGPQTAQQTANDVPYSTQLDLRRTEDGSWFVEDKTGRSAC